MQHQGTCGGCRAPGVAQRMNIQRRMMSRQESSIQTLGRRGLQVVSARSRKVADEESNVAAMDTTAVEPEVNQGAYQNTYQSVGDTPPEYPIQPPPVVAPAGSGLPAWVWVMVGVLLANVLNKAIDFVRRPREVMSEMMMKQMANAMGSQMGGSPGQTPPGTNPFAFPPGGFPAQPPPASTAQSTAPVYDTWATTPTPTPAPAPAPSPPPPPQPTPTAPNPGAGNGTSSGFDPAGITNPAPTDPGVESATTQASQPSSSFFQDVEGASSPTAGAQQPELASSSDDASIDQFFENLKDPSMRESLYQYLPENMRKPETLDMLMSNPMVRDQFRKMMKEGGGLQNFNAAQGGMPMNAGMDPAVQDQLKSMNVDPQVLGQKLMADPELFQLLNKPNVMSAVMDLQQNPDKVSQYMSDPEVMKVLMKMNELALSAQAESAAQGAPAPGVAPPPPMGQAPPSPMGQAPPAPIDQAPPPQQPPPVTVPSDSEGTPPPNVDQQ